MIHQTNTNGGVDPNETFDTRVDLLCEDDDDRPSVAKTNTAKKTNLCPAELCPVNSVLLILVLLTMLLLLVLSVLHDQLVRPSVIHGQFVCEPGDGECVASLCPGGWRWNGLEDRCDLKKGGYGDRRCTVLADLI